LTLADPRPNLPLRPDHPYHHTRGDPENAVGIRAAGDGLVLVGHGEMPLKLKGLMKIKKTLATGKTIYYCYAWRGVPLLKTKAGEPIVSQGVV
jgi:hypothetical protein